MTKEDAIQNIKKLIGYSNTLDESIFTLFPALKESEDEKIRKKIVSAICYYRNDGCISEYEFGVCRNWLEKQKETPKSADSIPSDCVSDAKYENRWHKVSDSLPDTPREVLCKDAIGNYFIGRYYGTEPWEVSVYDDTDKTNEYNPPVVEWADILVEEEPKEGIRGGKEEIPSFVDLEKEIEKAQEHYFALKDKGFSLDSMDVSVLPRHFYELGRKGGKV